MSALELYQQTVKTMSPVERLQLASLILNDLTSIDRTVDESDRWSDADLADLTKATWAHIDQQIGDEGA